MVFVFKTHGLLFALFHISGLLTVLVDGSLIGWGVITTFIFIVFMLGAWRDEAKPRRIDKK